MSPRAIVAKARVHPVLSMRVGAGFSQAPGSSAVVATSAEGVSQADGVGPTRCYHAPSFDLESGRPSRSFVAACQTVLDERLLVDYGMLLWWTL